MAEKVNTQSVFTNEKFITLETLTYFWGKTKEYINPISGDVTTLKDDVAALQTTVGDNNSGLVAEVNDIRLELEGINEGAGSISTQINNALAALDVTDEAVAGEYVSSVAEVDGKVVVTRAALPDYSNTYDAMGAAAAAEAAAIAHANGLASNYDAAGSASAAETAAKAYADGLGVKYDASGAAATVQGNLDSHTANAVAHVTADDRTAWNAAKTAIDAFLKNADMSEKAVDTLAELQTYMTTDGAAAAQVVERIGALETTVGKEKDGDNPATGLVARVGALEAADNYIKTDVDAAIADAKKAGTDAAAALDTYKGEMTTTLAGKADTSVVEPAIADAKKAGTDAAAALDTYKGEMTTTLAGKADKSVVDGLVTTVGNTDSGLVARVNALEAADDYVKANVDKQISDAKAEAIADAAAKLKEVTDTLKSAAFVEVATLEATMDAKDATNLAAAKTYAATYTDNLFDSFKFANETDIDRLFTTTNA